MGVSKNKDAPKMDGLQWKTLLRMDDLGVTMIFGNTHVCTYIIINYMLDNHSLPPKQV